MPQKHSKKEKRQVGHIVAGYERRGVPRKKAKSIAFATVSKQQNESWMFNGAGQPVFMGNPGNVSQFNPAGSVSPGGGYVPDEVARMLVKESGLRKLDTISKVVIENYLESMRLSKGLAVDVARVLRDVYGITPTFNESTIFARSGALIEELNGVVNESFPMPFAVDDEPQELTEVGIISSFIQSEFLESNDEGYDIALGVLATLSPSEFCDVVDFHEWVGPEVFSYIESIVEAGHPEAAMQVVDGLCWPSRIQFMPEDIQDLFEGDARSVISDFKKKRQLQKPVSARKQMKLYAKDRADVQKADPLATKKSAHNDAKMAAAHSGEKSAGAVKSDPALAGKVNAMRAKKDDSAWSSALDKAKARIADGDKAKSELAKSAAMHNAEADKKKAEKGGFLSRMKRAGKKTVDAIQRTRKFVHEPSKFNVDASPVKNAAGSLAKGAAGLAFKGVKAAVGGAAEIAGHGIKRMAQGAFGGKAAKGAEGGKSKKSADAKPEKIGIGGRIARAIGGFVHHVKQGYHDATPGIRSQMPKGDDHASGPEAKKKERKTSAPPIGGTPQESVYRNGSILSEMAAEFSGEYVEDELEEEEEVMSPAGVVSTLGGDTIVDIAVLEALGEMNWDGVANIAGFMMLEPERFLSLIQSFKESRSVFRAEWSELEESGDKPSWMNLGSFVTLANLSLDEDVVPRLVYWAGRTLQAADSTVSAYVSESYPELGKTVYGPAGNPKEGPELAKAFMTPHPAGTMTPGDGGCTTRMFSDPDDRKKERKSKLDDVMAALDGMRKAADAAGVDPEGMFLNLYRDMHREKVRYS